jgi:transcription elongation factor Elf1
MIAHLVRKLVPPRMRRFFACPSCGFESRTETHLRVYCLACGQPIEMPRLGPFA